MHDWGDKSVDWEGINAAAEYIGEGLRKWGRVSCDYKEKFGTVRVYTSFGWYQFHSIWYPGYHWNQWPEWLWHLDCRVGGHLVKPLSALAVLYQRWLYRRLYRKAAARWPHLKEEILCCADYPELLEDL